MSHIVQMKTELTNPTFIKAGLKFLGLNYKENSTVRVWGEEKPLGEIVIVLDKYDIGLNKLSDGTFGIICDHYAYGEFGRQKALSKYPKNSFTQEGVLGILTQASNIAKAQYIANKNGDDIQISEPDSNGVIHAQVIQS